LKILRYLPKNYTGAVNSWAAGWRNEGLIDMKVQYLPAILLFVFCTGFLPAQSTAEEIETLLSTRAVSYASASRFLLEASEKNITSDPDEAYRYAAERNWLPKSALANEAARLDDISLLLMSSFDIKGGLLYSAAKNPHYAYRELVYKNIIQGRADPAMNVSGERLLFITNRVLSMLDEEASIAAEREQRRLRAEESGRQKTETMSFREALVAKINSIIKSNRIPNAKAEVTDEGVMIRLSNIQFEADSYTLPESEKEKLREIADILKSIPERKIQVAGHTALAGSVEGQLMVSRERAQAVASYLVLLGARHDSEVTVIAYGAEMPIAGNSTPEGMAANRRVEIIILEN
jgi:outer membrane protein OmpA-like peptidoglycan-associated protein